MVSGIGSLTDYSVVGSLNILPGADGSNSVNSADDTFPDILSDTESDDKDTETVDISEKAAEKSDLYEYIKDSMGMPPGVNVEGFEYSKSADSPAQASSGSSSASGSGGKNEMDLNNDGVVTADEVMRYIQNQQKNGLSDTLQNSLNKYSSENITGGLNTINASNAYNSLSSASGSAMTLNIAI